MFGRMGNRIFVYKQSSMKQEHILNRCPICGAQCQEHDAAPGSVQVVDDRVRHVGTTYTEKEFAILGSKPLQRPQPIIKVDRTAYIMFEKQDLAEQERFLRDFGMIEAAKTGDAIYMRGAGTDPYFYVAKKGKASKYVGAGFAVNTRAELLELLRAVPGTTIEAVDGPGGGERVRLVDPGGFLVDVVYGRKEVDPLPLPPRVHTFNSPLKKERLNVTVRPPLAPTPVYRFSHVVLGAVSFEISAQWYMRHLGLIPSDVQCLADGTPALAFMRLDRGDQPADHHTVVVAGIMKSKYLHSAYETSDIDAIGQGQQILKAAGWKHFWGIGRHALGSQLFDYWLDPYGHELEHYADGDVFDASHPAGYHFLELGGMWMWGDDIPESLRKGPSLSEKLKALASVMTGKLSGETLKLTAKALERKARPWLR